MSCIWFRKIAVMAISTSASKKDMQSNRKKEQAKKTTTVPQTPSQIHRAYALQCAKIPIWRDCVRFFSLSLLPIACLCSVACLSIHENAPSKRQRRRQHVSSNADTRFSTETNHQLDNIAHFNFCEMRYCCCCYWCCIVTTSNWGFLFIFKAHLSYNEQRVDFFIIHFARSRSHPPLSVWPMFVYEFGVFVDSRTCNSNRFQ